MLCWSKSYCPRCLAYSFDELFKTEARINEIYMSMAEEEPMLMLLWKKWASYRIA